MISFAIFAALREKMMISRKDAKYAKKNPKILVILTYEEFRNCDTSGGVFLVR